MKLLIITQLIDKNDDNLGFFHRWILEFAKHCESVTVIAQQAGRYDLPRNARVLSLGKERGRNKLGQLINFYRAIWREAPAADVIFAHMIPMWVVLGSPIFSFYGKPVYLWYTHKSVDWLLRLAEKNVRKIFTASRESFRLKSDKVEIMGHGIDTEYFTPRPELRDPKTFRVISTGRITRSKRLREMILTVAELQKNWKDDRRLVLDIIGGARMPEDERYAAELKELIQKNNLTDVARILPPRPYSEMAVEYQKSDLMLNFSLTGSLDKAVLEAMACGVNVLTSNEAFFAMLPAENIIRDLDASVAANKLLSLSAQKLPKENLRAAVLRDHDLRKLIGRLFAAF